VSHIDKLCFFTLYHNDFVPTAGRFVTGHHHHELHHVHDFQIKLLKLCYADLCTTRRK